MDNMNYIIFLDRFKDSALTSVFLDALNNNVTYDQAKSTLPNNYASLTNQNVSVVSSKIMSIIQALKIMNAWSK